LNASSGYHGVQSTHPVYVSLDHPLSGYAAKRVRKIKESPLYACVERVVQRSDVGVIQYGDRDVISQQLKKK
jgi:hypothetical protein